MDEITKKIINIDNVTINMKSRYKILMEKKEDELRDAILEMEKKYSNETIQEGDRVYQEIINKAVLKNKGPNKVNVNYNDINNTYNKLKSGLIESIWVNLFLGKE